MPTIVVASDDWALRELLHLLLEDRGYRVRATTDAPGTLEAVEEAANPLLLVLDLSLTDLQALDVLRVVGADPYLCFRHAYLLLAPQDHTLPPDVWPLLEALALPMLTKPLDLDEFLETIAVLALSLRATPPDADPPRPLTAFDARSSSNSSFLLPPFSHHPLPLRSALLPMEVAVDNSCLHPYNGVVNRAISSVSGSGALLRAREALMRHPFRTSRRDDGLTVSSLVETQLPPAPPTARHPVLIRLATTLLLVAVVGAFLVGVATNHLPSLSATKASTMPTRGGSIVSDGWESQSLLPWLTGNSLEAQALWAPLWYGDPQGEFHPGIASEVPSSTNGGISADFTTWTIHLRPDLKWSDGSPLTAEDCAFSFNLYFDPAFGAGFPPPGPDDLVGYLGATTIDTMTVVVPFRHVLPILAWFADGSGSCIPKEVFGKMTAADIASSQVSFQPSVVSGPFRIKEYVAGDHMTFVRNPYYYQGPEKPYLDQITFKYLRGDAVLTALQAHAIDTYWDLDYTKLASYRAITGYTTYLDAYSAWYELLAFNLTDPILSDHAVRQAITMSIDRNRLIQTALNGAGSLICDDGVGTFSHEANLTCYPFDPSGAGVLLDGDGWTMGTDGYRHKNGQMLELEYATTAKPYRAVTQELIRDELKAIGMKIDLKVYTQQDDFFGSNSGTPGALTNGHFQIAEFANNNDYEPSDYNLFKSIASPDPGHANWMHYANPEVDQLLESQAATADFTTRKADFHTIHADVLKDLPVMYLHSPLDISCARSDLHNYNPSPEGATETWNVWDWWLSVK